jgi:rhodanese-related sulfurtransferase
MKNLLLTAAALFAAANLYAGGACCPATQSAKATGDAAEAKATASVGDAKAKLTAAKDAAECAVNMEAAAAKLQQAQAAGSGAVTTAALKELVKSGAPVVILDARTGKYDDGKRIPGAQLAGPDPSEAEIAKLVPAKNATVVTYCGSKQCPLSGKLATKLRGLGYANVIEYHEGIAGWVAAGNDVSQVATN